MAEKSLSWGHFWLCLCSQFIVTKEGVVYECTNFFPNLEFALALTEVCDVLSDSSVSLNKLDTTLFVRRVE